MSGRQPFIKNARTAKQLGWVLFIAGGLILYDAYDGRGGHAPWPLGIVLPF